MQEILIYQKEIIKLIKDKAVKTQARSQTQINAVYRSMRRWDGCLYLIIKGAIRVCEKRVYLMAN